MARIATRVEVLPAVAARVKARSKPGTNGCLISTLAPSKPRPWVWLPEGRQVSAIRVVAAVKLGRPIEPNEDVHHTCHKPRCVEETHLLVMLLDDHSSEHAEQLTQDRCTVHDRPYDRRDSRGWGVCLACGREGTARYKEANSDKVKAYERPEKSKARKREADKARRATPEYKAKAAAAQRARRARLKQEQQN